MMATGAWRPSWASIGFVVTVVLPTTLVAAYLYGAAADQYHSRVAFSVRSLEQTGGANVLGILSAGGGGATEDAIVVYDFLRSQKIVELIEKRAPFETIFNPPQGDPVFGLGTGRSIEDKASYWNLAATVSFDSSSRVIEIETRAFSPEDARRLARIVAEESENLVNRLSARAREDAVGFAERDVRDAEAHLRKLRVQLSQFRNRTQEIDPTAGAQLQIELVASLERSLASAETKRQSMLTYLGENAPSIRVLNRQIESLREQIKRERNKLAGGAAGATGGSGTLEQRLAQFEALTVDIEFAGNLYTAALTALSQAETDARRSQRYLAVHIEPTLAEEAIYPRRALLSVSVFITLWLIWSITRLIGASITART